MRIVNDPDRMSVLWNMIADGDKLECRNNSLSEWEPAIINREPEAVISRSCEYRKMLTKEDKKKEAFDKAYEEVNANRHVGAYEDFFNAGIKFGKENN